MRATIMFGAGDVRIENVPDARIVEPTNAVVSVTRACICGSNLWPYQKMEHSDTGRLMGHEAIGIVEAVGPDVRAIKAGDLVIMPFAFSDGTCVFCRAGLHTSCIHGGFFGTPEDRSRRSTTMSWWAVAPRPSGRTSRNSCPTSSRVGSIPAGSSIAR
jgi:threonine dehydrogenase-like Zn-dependent dehydrogenase